jgi:hypothetical protein
MLFLYIRFGGFTAVTIKNAVFRMILVRIDVSEVRIASIIRVTIGELGTLAVTSNRRALRRNTETGRVFGMDKGVGVADSGLRYLNGQSKRRDSIVSEEGGGIEEWSLLG